MNNTASPPVITRRSQLDAALGTITEPAIAVDTESNSLYAYHEHICLIQISTSQADLIVDPLSNLDLSPLGDLFADPTIQKVFHAAEQDVAGMKRDFDFRFANLFDTMWAARILGWERIGLADALQENFGVHTDKRYQRFDWGERPLPAEALAYARMDTCYLLPLRKLQTEALELAGHDEEAAEVFEELAKTEPATQPFGPEAFWRMKGIRDLKQRERSVLWELYVWRDRVADDLDRPPFKVLGNKTLLALADSQPDRLDDLVKIPGLKRHHIRRYGQHILGAISRGQNGPAPRPPRKPRPTEAARERFEALRAWRRKKAAERRVDSDVILSNTVLWALAEDDPSTPQDLETVAGLGPWKRRHYGADILRVLARST